MTDASQLDENDEQPAPRRMAAGGAASSPGRRRAMAGLLAGLLLGDWRRAAAADDLLDPGRIGSVGRSGGAEGLLDPDRLGAKAPAASGEAPARGGGKRHAPGYPRDMAGSVVGALNTLTRAAADMVDEIHRLEEKARQLAERLRKLIEERDAKLEEYRQGLFCSGCGKTKSEILSRGEKFPHPGQKIIRPTPQQIAAKERELQAPIDQTDKELREVRAKLAKLMGERDEALLQIGFGLALWRTSLTFETNIIDWEERDGEAAYRAERAKVDGQDRKLFLELSQVKKGDVAKQKALRAEKDMWAEIGAKLDNQRAADRRAHQQARTRAAAAAGGEKARLEEYLARGKLHLVLVVVVSTQPIGTAASFNDLGGPFRMGSYSLAGHDEVLPRVNAFINDFRNTPGPALTAAVAAPPAPPKAPAGQGAGGRN